MDGPGSYLRGETGETAQGQGGSDQPERVRRAAAPKLVFTRWIAVPVMQKAGCSRTIPSIQSRPASLFRNVMLETRTVDAGCAKIRDAHGRCSRRTAASRRRRAAW